MKNLKKIFFATLMLLTFSLPASAQLRFGVKAGAAINKISFDKDVLLNTDNRAGFTGGVMAEFTVPVLGIGADASVLYAQRSLKIENGGSENRSYIDIPVNFKWKIGIPAVGKLVTPFITTGPDFSFLCSKKNINGALKNKSFDFAWNVGLGVELISHLQVAANYGIGISSSVSGPEALYGKNAFDGKNRCWTVTLAYLF